MQSITKKIKTFNKGRVPELVKLKYKLISKDVFRFYRGTCHLFYESFSKKMDWQDNTKCWITGDLHIENFGSYKGDDHVVYFDLNDFEESALAPATWELARLLTSIHLATKVLNLNQTMAQSLCSVFTVTYIKTLQNGQPLLVDKETSEGLLKYFLDQVESRKEKTFLKDRVLNEHKKWKLIIDGKKTILPSLTIRESIKQQLSKALKEYFPQKGYSVKDVAYRVAGTASVGLQRYIVLVQEKKSGKLHLMDVKESRPSSLARYCIEPQPKFLDEACRIVAVQKMVQHVSPAVLHNLTLNERPFVMKELQPSEDRMNLEICKGQLSQLSTILVTMAQITASAQLRSAGMQGSSIVKELINFANSHKKWDKKLMDFARQYAKQLGKDYNSYCQ